VRYLPQEESALKYEESVPKTTVDLLATIAFLTISIIAERHGDVWISLFLTCVSLFLLVNQLDWPRKVLGIKVIRWQFWFSIECVCFFLFFSVFGLSSKGYFVDTPQSSGISDLPTWIAVYVILWIISPLFVFFRHDYLAPKRLRSCLEGKDSSEYSVTREKQQKLEGGVLALCSILGLGFSDYLDFILLLVSIFLAVSGIRERREIRKQASLDEMAKEYRKQSNKFWTRFSQAPRRFMGSFFIFSFLYFLNLPSLNPYSFQEMIVILIMSLALALIGIAIRYDWAVKKTKPIVTLFSVLLLYFTIMNGDPAAYPFIERFISENFEIRSFWLFTQFWMFCVGIFFLNTGPQIFLRRPETKIRQKLKNLARASWYVIITVSYIVMIVWSFASIPLPQIKLLLVLGMALLLTVPLFRSVKI
jgi:hypothetical protein